ncbi:MAG: ankyrin repeat domain-containing protein [Akkermansia sp.]|nr:ankyrin repeat domain-containing protein [Akkermansia sp.]
MLEKDIKLAVDFGVAETYVAAECGGSVTLVQLGGAAGSIPSAVCMTSDGKLHFGESAVAHGALHPGGYCLSYKNMLGCPAPVLGMYTAADLLREFLKYLKARVVEYFGGSRPECRSVILTCPASFTEVQRQEMRAAAEAAGFTDIRMITELHALASRWLAEDDAVDGVQGALLVNWDAGRMECRLLQAQEDGLGFDPRVGCYLLSVGFESLDVRLARYIIDKLNQVKNVNKLSWPELLTRVRELRSRLMANRADDILSIEIGRQLVKICISYAEFKVMADVDILRAASALRAVYKRIPESAKPKVIMLTGEAVNMPGLKKTIANSLGLPVHFRHNRADIALESAELLIGNPLPDEPDEPANIDVELFCAVWDGNVEKVRELLRRPEAEVNIMTEDGTTLLHAAVQADTCELTQLLLAAGADPNVVDNMGLTPLWNAVSAERWDCAGQLIKGGADVNAKDSDGWTLLHRAAANNHLQVLAVLLTIPNLDVNCTNDENETALYIAAAAGNSQAVEQILAVPGVDLSIRDNSLGFTALEVADFNNHVGCVELLRAVVAH